MKDQIIDYLNRNRVSTTEVADALGKCGALKNVMPINRGHYRAGSVKWVYAYEESNWSLHEQIAEIDENQIIFVDDLGCNDKAIFGELVSKYLILYRQSKALVVNGKLRDAAALIRQNWPIWCTGFNPEGCFNIKPSIEAPKETVEERQRQYDGAIAVCDDCGVVIIPPSLINEEMLKKLQDIENQEDIWFDRLDYYKENTFEIVCERKYLRDNNKGY